MALLTGSSAQPAHGVGHRSSLYEHQDGAVFSTANRSSKQSSILSSRTCYLAANLFYRYEESLQGADFFTPSEPVRHCKYPSIITLSSVQRFHSPDMSGHQQGGESSRSQSEDWRGVEDQGERRKIQNRLAQRKYRKCSHSTWRDWPPDAYVYLGDKEKRKRDDEARVAQNQQVAGSAYAAPDAKDLARNANPAGLPWGSVSLKYVVETGKAKEERAQQVSREGSAGPAYSRRGTQG